jgi:hypothetical protein
MMVRGGWQMMVGGREGGSCSRSRGKRIRRRRRKPKSLYGRVRWGFVVFMYSIELTLSFSSAVSPDLALFRLCFL